jgi:hypothetical protein
MLVMNISCIKEKALAQKQGEYSSGHSCKYCNIVESVIVQCKFHVKIQLQNKFLNYNYSVGELAAMIMS